MAATRTRPHLMSAARAAGGSERYDRNPHDPSWDHDGVHRMAARAGPRRLLRPPVGRPFFNQDIRLSGTMGATWHRSASHLSCPSIRDTATSVLYAPTAAPVFGSHRPPARPCGARCRLLDCRALHPHSTSFRRLAMRLFAARVSTAFVFLLAGTILHAQQSPRFASTSVPRVMHVTGVFVPTEGQSRASVETVTLAIYAEEHGGTPLWQETQQVVVDSSGRYAILLGATQPDGLPLDLFASGDARWLERRFDRVDKGAQTRVLLASVPYALRAADSDTLGGRPASDYLLAGTGDVRASVSNRAQEASIAAPEVVLAGIPNSLAKYLNATDIGPTSLFETGGGLIGAGTPSPFDAFHVRFTNTSGGMTGLAVQNMGNTATSYSGMLFYDQNGALGQFQGFNNSTHEYRINNIAKTGANVFNGSINFMVGGISKFFVSPVSVGIGTTSPSSSSN